ncbi:MAG: YHYH protein [Candidatus Dormibacteraeota bacterium]|uniref:YHYH protein n=1 Tax=Candidatus Amunia macphersoniae TaxID=3127014 RepID=A0A934NH39_9BACT|nr:YHYH protein [Candidatus Dormibacteraeota bacterium]
MTAGKPTPSSAAAGRTLRIGDGKVSTAPAVGSVDSCQTAFAPPSPSTSAPWIHPDGTWDPTAKPAVNGSVVWPQADYSVTLDNDTRTLTTNDLPVGGRTGAFSAAAAATGSGGATGSAAIRPQTYRFILPASPVIREQPACLPLGAIGVLNDGVLLYDALDAQGRDAVAHEIQDWCGGHPETSGAYHFHDVSTCFAVPLPFPAPVPDRPELIGYALDGFGIYIDRDSSGHLLTNADLDVCHGRTSLIPWDGKEVVMYHYDVTAAYPYTTGCFRGSGSGSAWNNH